jgi:hypothetical protein
LELKELQTLARPKIKRFEWRERFVALAPGNAEQPALGVRVARLFIFKPKIPIWVNFGGP